MIILMLNVNGAVWGVYDLMLKVIEGCDGWSGCYLMPKHDVVWGWGGRGVMI